MNPAPGRDTKTETDASNEVSVGRSAPVLGEAEFALALDDRWTIVGCNEAFARWLGYDGPEGLVGRPLAQTLDPANLGKLAEVARRFAAGSLIVAELNHRTCLGRPALARYHLFPPGTLGPDQARILAFGSDRQPTINLLEELIDLKREREAQLARTRDLNVRLERQNADLSAISHMINHDVSNSLNAINLTAILLERRQPASPAQVIRSTRDIQGLCRHVSGMMKGFVALADIAHTPLRPEMVDLEATAAELLRLVATNRPEVVHEATTHFATAPAVFADPNHVRQVLENLLSNAFKYRDPSRPVLQLRLGSAPSPSGTTVIEVADNALGIPPDLQANIFDLHTRAHTNVAEGHGVGLAIVRRLIEANGGTITLESQPGLGSTFRITLPSRPKTGCRVEIP